jgi:hypothetical protein
MPSWEPPNVKDKGGRMKDKRIRILLHPSSFIL